MSDALAMTDFTLTVKRGNGTEKSTQWQEFTVPVVSDSMSVLDALFWTRHNLEPSLAFRCACRVGMCGTCGTVINGREGLACRTLIRELIGDGDTAQSGMIRVEPLRHLPVIRDLATDPARFNQKLTAVMPQLSPKQNPDGDLPEPATIRPDSKERRIIDPQRECIYCGLCYSACTVAGLDSGFLGPAALNRAFTVISDSRDGATKQRLEIVASEQGLWRCHTIFDCTAVCPKGIPITKGIEGLKRKVVVSRLKRLIGLGD
jgi:succinate dehydrogenase/fumarate reductase iron-sulfur protein